MIVMGRTGAPFGVKGWIKVQPFTESVLGLLEFKQWWLRGQSGWEAVRVVEQAVHGAGLVVRFEGISDRNDAALLRGRDVAVPRSALPATAPDEFYLADLVGLEVENANGEHLGTVERLIETGVNAVLVVDGERKQLLPFVENVIRRIDVAAGKVYVEWEGSH